MLPPPSCPGPPVGGGLRPAPLGKGSVSHRFPLLRNAPAPRRGGPMCPPGHASSRDPFRGRHTGRPLRIRLKYQSPPKQRAGTEARPYRSIAVPGGGPMYLRHGFRRPNFVPKFWASAIGIGLYGETGKSQQTPGPAAHSGASAARSQGMGGFAGKIRLGENFGGFFLLWGAKYPGKALQSQKKYDILAS